MAGHGAGNQSRSREYPAAEQAEAAPLHEPPAEDVRSKHQDVGQDVCAVKEGQVGVEVIGVSGGVAQAVAPQTGQKAGGQLQGTDQLRDAQDAGAGLSEPGERRERRLLCGSSKPSASGSGGPHHRPPGGSTALAQLRAISTAIAEFAKTVAWLFRGTSRHRRSPGRSPVTKRRAATQTSPPVR